MTVRLKPSMKISGRVILDRFIPEINLSNNTIAENASIGTVVGSASVQNAGGSTFTFELVDEGSTGDFSMTTGGVISVASALNHEEQSTYPVQIKSVDSRGHKYAIATNLVVGDVNEPPVDINLSNNEVKLSIETSGTYIGTATAVDPDVSDPKVWSLASAAGGQFAIDANTGDLTIQSPVKAGTQSIEIQVEDSGNLTYTEQFTITVSAPQLKYKSTTIEQDGNFGIGAALSPDGSIAAIGAREDVGGGVLGRLRVYQVSGNSISLLDTIENPGTETGVVGFGDFNTVALTSAANTILVGAPLDGTFGGDAGVVYVYNRSGNSWSLGQTISQSVAGDAFGRGVAATPDGSVAVIGANGYDGAGPSSNTGRAFVYEYSGTSYTQSDTLLPSPQPNGGLFGWTCQISDSGDTILVTGRGQDNTSNGLATIYDRTSPSVWTLTQNINHSALTNDELYGYFATLSPDGTAAVISSLWEDESGNNRQGAAYVWEESGGTWTNTQRITRSERAGGDVFGYGVSISEDKSVIVVGAPLVNDFGLNNTGSVSVFKKTGGSFEEQSQIFSFDLSENANFGFDLALSRDGEFLIVAANAEDSTETNSGAVYTIDLS